MQTFDFNGYKRGFTVDHKDRNEANNSLENLKWPSRKTQSYNRENREYKYKEVVCLNDWKSFNSYQEAEDYYGLTKKYGFKGCKRGKKKHTRIEVLLPKNKRTP